MPIYEFYCESCDTVTEKLLPISQCDFEQKCEKCNNPMKRRISVSDFQFKGAPPRHWKPLTKSNPKSEVRTARDLIESRKRNN